MRKWRENEETKRERKWNGKELDFRKGSAF